MTVRGNRSVHDRDPDAGQRAGIDCGCGLRGSQHIEAYDARTGEMLDSEEVRQGRAKEVREFDEFEVTMEVDESEMRLEKLVKMAQQYDVGCVPRK